MSDKLQKIYCFDSSAFISLHRAEKSIPIPSLWNELDKLFKENKLISHIKVYDELNPVSKKIR